MRQKHSKLFSLQFCRWRKNKSIEKKRWIHFYGFQHLIEWANDESERFSVLMRRNQNIETKVHLSYIFLLFRCPRTKWKRLEILSVRHGLPPDPFLFSDANEWNEKCFLLFCFCFFFFSCAQQSPVTLPPRTPWAKSRDSKHRASHGRSSSSSAKEVRSCSVGSQPSVQESQVPPLGGIPSEISIIWMVSHLKRNRSVVRLFDSIWKLDCTSLFVFLGSL